MSAFSVVGTAPSAPAFELVDAREKKDRMFRLPLVALIAFAPDFAPPELATVGEGVVIRVF